MEWFNRPLPANKQLPHRHLFAAAVFTHARTKRTAQIEAAMTS
jgi:hypothetical protein